MHYIIPVTHPPVLDIHVPHTRLYLCIYLLYMYIHGVSMQLMCVSLELCQITVARVFVNRTKKHI